MKTNNIGFVGTAAQLAAKEKGISISNVVVVQPPKVSAVDIKKYTDALKMAYSGKRSALVNLQNEMLNDPVVNDAVERRIRHITNGELQLQVDNKEVDEMSDFIKSPKFRELLREALLTRFFGKSVIETLFSPEGMSVYPVPRQNLNTVTKKILRSLSDADGIPYEGDDFLLNLGKDNDFGLLSKVAPYVIFKRNGGSDYAQFCELFGIPILAGMYDPDDEGSREEMEKTMMNRGAGGSVVMSNKGKLETIGETGGQGNTVHRPFLEYLDEQILIGLLGQTMTTKNGSSRSQSETHAQTEDDINSDDRIYILEILNHELLPKLEKRGYPVKGGWFVYPKKDNLTIKEKFDIAAMVEKNTENGIDEDWYYETSGMPKAKTQKNTPQENPDPNVEDPQHSEPDQKNPAQPKKIKAKKLSLYQQMMDFFDQAPR